MKNWKLLLSLLLSLSLLATACGGSDGDDGGDGAASGDDTTVDTGTDTGDADDAADDAADDGGDAAPASSAGTGGELLLLQWQAPSQANPHLSSGSKDVLAGSLVLEPLARIDPDGQLVATLATEVPTAANGGISDDLTQITWKLRDDVLWSDGTPLTALDAVFTWEYCADELTGCTHSNFSDVVDVEATDEYTIVVTFDGPTPYPFEPFVGPSGPILQEAQFRDCIGEGSAACSDQNFMPIGTGPFMVTELRPEDTVSYAMNPNYRGVPDGKPYFGEVTIKGGGDAESAARSVLEIGEADFAWNLQVAPEILGPMEAAGNGRVEVAFTSSVEHININFTNNRADGDAKSNYLDGTNPHPILFENPELIRALSMAIDRDVLVAVGYGPNGRPTCNMWNIVGQTSTNNDWCLTRDVDGAIAILDGLGYVDTDGDGIRETDDGIPLEFDYATSTNAVRQSNQEVIKANWAEIGVEVNMKNEDPSLFFDGTNAQGLSIWHFFNDMEMFTNLPDSPDPGAYLGGWESDQIPTLENAWGGNNFTRMANDEYDKLLDELQATPLDDPGRADLVIHLNDILSADSGAIIPLILRGDVSAFGNDIENTGPLNGWDSQYWNIEDWTRAG